MTAPVADRRRRWRPPRREGTALLALLASVTAAIAVVAVVLAVLAYARLDGQVERVDRLTERQTVALRTVSELRRLAIHDACRQREALKAAARPLLDEPPRAFQPVDCDRYVARLAPPSLLPHP